MLTLMTTDIVFMASKTALFAVFRASSRVTNSFLSKESVSISANKKLILNVPL